MIRYESDSLDLGKWLETLRPQRKLVKKESGGRKVPFLPQPMGRPAVEASLAPPRAAERRELSGNCAVGGSIPGKRQKSATPGTRTRASERRGRKFYPLGQKIAVLKMANKTLRGSRKNSPESGLAEAATMQSKIRGRSEARGAFPNSPIREWPSGKSLPRQSRGPGFKPQVKRIFQAVKSSESEIAGKKIVTKEIYRG